MNDMNSLVYFNFLETLSRFSSSEYFRAKRLFSKWHYLTIKLRAWDFCEVIVDEGQARINYHLIEIESE